MARGAWEVAKDCAMVMLIAPIAVALSVVANTNTKSGTLGAVIVELPRLISWLPVAYLNLSDVNARAAPAFERCSLAARLVVESSVI